MGAKIFRVRTKLLHLTLLGMACCLLPIVITGWSSWVRHSASTQPATSSIVVYAEKGRTITSLYEGFPPSRETVARVHRFAELRNSEVSRPCRPRAELHQPLRSWFRDLTQTSTGSLFVQTVYAQDCQSPCHGAYMEIIQHDCAEYCSQLFWNHAHGYGSGNPCDGYKGENSPGCGNCEYCEESLCNPCAS